MSAKRLWICLAVGLLLAVVTTTAAVAADTGRIEGRIARDDGAGVGGVIVEIEGLGRVTTSDSTGRFLLPDVPAGTYALSFTSGENVERREGVEVTAGTTTTLDVGVDWHPRFLETITVTSASRRTERITEAPAAVTVVPEEQIERQASHGQLPKLLEYTPGAEVTQSGIYDFNFNTRGFNSSLNRRVATLIDGRDPSVPFLGAQEWAALGFPLDDMASLELVRGPSAALYGANASSGVLNMTTKAPRYSQGGTVRLTAGELSTTNADLRWATPLGGDWYFKLLGGLRQSDDFTRSRVGAAEYTVPCTLPGQTDCLPQEAVPLTREDNDITFAAARIDRYFDNGAAVTLEGGQSTVQGPVFQTGIGRVQAVDVDRPWARFNFSTDHWNLLAYYNGRDAPEQTALSTGANLVLDSDNYQVELQTNWGLAGDRGRIVAGASYGEENIDTFDPRTGRQTLVFAPVESDSQALFAQLDWDLGASVKLVLAGRYDDSSLHDSQFSPKGSLVWGVAPNHTLRLTYNEAFQVANYSEFFLQAQVGAFPGAPLEGVCQLFGTSCGLPALVPVLAVGNEDLTVEEVETVELGYAGVIADKAFLTVDYYRSDNTNFITDLVPQLGTPLGRANPNFGPLDGVSPLLAGTLDGVVQMFIPGAGLSNNLDGSPVIIARSYTNFGQVDTQGVDLGLAYYATDQWRVDFSYSWFDFEIQDPLPGLDELLLPNSPENKFTLGTTYTGESFDATVSYRWVDDFRWVVGPFQGPVESYSVVDLVVNYHFTDNWTLGLNAANLLDEEHWEAFGGDLLGRRALASIAYNW